mmetsp:Transcript_94110/g.201984  ORF Transcript_94110/g.201984 Transcript_94110/m.201984 type:complete len:224 (-) Transcript_94110:1663-2334(-)
MPCPAVEPGLRVDKALLQAIHQGLNLRRRLRPARHSLVHLRLAQLSVHGRHLQLRWKPTFPSPLQDVVLRLRGCDQGTIHLVGLKIEQEDWGVWLDATLHLLQVSGRRSKQSILLTITLRTAIAHKHVASLSSYIVASACCLLPCLSRTTCATRCLLPNCCLLPCLRRTTCATRCLLPSCCLLPCLSRATYTTGCRLPWLSRACQGLSWACRRFSRASFASST